MVKVFFDSVIKEINECESYLEVTLETICSEAKGYRARNRIAASKKKSSKKNVPVPFLSLKMYSETFTRAADKLIHLKSLRSGLENELEGNSISAVTATQMTNYVSLVLRFINEKLEKAKQMHHKFSELLVTTLHETSSSTQKHNHPTELSKFYIVILEDLLMWYRQRTYQWSGSAQVITVEMPLLADTAYTKMLFLKYSGLLALMRKTIVKKNGSEHRANIAKAIAYITGEEFSNVNSYLSDLIDDDKTTTNNKNLYKEPNLRKVSDTMRSFGLSTAEIDEKLKKVEEGTKD